MPHVADTKLFTKADVAKRYSVSVRTVHNWMKLNVVPFLKLPGRCVRFDVAATDAALEQYSINARKTKRHPQMTAITRLRGSHSTSSRSANIPPPPGGSGNEICHHW